MVHIKNMLGKTVLISSASHLWDFLCSRIWVHLVDNPGGRVKTMCTLRRFDSWLRTVCNVEFYV